MKTLRRLIFLSFLLVFPLVSSFVFSQVTGEWLGAEVEFDLPKKFSLEVGAEARALNPGGIRIYKYLTQAGLNYKISKRFDIAFKYRLAWRLEENMHYYYRNKMMLDLKFDYPVKRFKFDYRARFHRITKTYVNSETDLVPTVHFRNKFACSYNVPKNPILPSVFVELFTPLNGYKPGPFDEIRFGADLRYPLAKKQSIRGGIMYIHENFETRLSGIIFSLSYKISVG